MLTRDTGVVRLDVHFLDLAIFNDDSVSLAANVAENRSCVKVGLKGLRKLG